ncbi:MAG: class I SAM-dependent methyltransferase [Desulfobacterales bacterium]
MHPEADSAERALARTYNQMPYAGNPYCLTHPSLLSAFGCLYGLNPAPPESSRVLELGCGDGGNLVPMACQLPESQFLGIDLSTVQIKSGRTMCDALALKNIRLETRSILDIGASDGMFDYIVGHGVYSWVPDRVKTKILEICRTNLSDQGIAYISYNVLPGWTFNRSMRDMMRYRTRRLKDPKKRTAAALDLVKTMLDATTDSTRVHDVQLRFFGKSLNNSDDMSSYLLHEYMEANNDPIYFHQFTDALHSHGLAYICDAEQSDFEMDTLPADAAKKFEEIAEHALDLEQYIDFLKNTRFRHSLVCRGGIELNSDFRLDRLARLFAATDVAPILDSTDSLPQKAKAFKTPKGRKFSTEHPLALNILRILSQIRPCTVDVSTLIQEVLALESAKRAGDSRKRAEKIGHALYALFFDGVVELLGTPRRCVVDNIGDYPTAAPVSRLQAPSKRVTNLCHRTISMNDDLACFVLARLNGKRNREALLNLILEGLRSGEVTLPEPYKGSEAETWRSLAKQLESMLHSMARCGFLIA